MNKKNNKAYSFSKEIDEEMEDVKKKEISNYEKQMYENDLNKMVNQLSKKINDVDTEYTYTTYTDGGTTTSASSGTINTSSNSHDLSKYDPYSGNSYIDFGNSYIDSYHIDPYNNIYNNYYNKNTLDKKMINELFKQSMKKDEIEDIKDSVKYVTNLISKNKNNKDNIIKEFTEKLDKILRESVITSKSKKYILDVVFTFQNMGIFEAKHFQNIIFIMTDLYSLLQKYHDVEFCIDFITKYPKRKYVEMTHEDVANDMEFKKFVNRLKLKHMLEEDE